ncbi:thioredoxin domain-containing protein [Erythrobacter sp. JK5]|uniref:DsbA family protein n=1 Tax=Erythrobacter sp. JK5 TaxID=2829500 RepID=UPI001BAAA707|nr:thioredoxin domain-containing protein [Erythrobacter sp. JK5]QUL38297.1 thioredoxin domain-containing protein [Erythrobacter sp. JK5]
MTALAAALALTGPASAQQQDLSNSESAFDNSPRKGNWQTVIVTTERGHLIGNPRADAQLIEFVSYTCGHCASFTAQGEPALDLVLLIPGKASLEVRPVIRNALDLTVSLLAACGDAKDFKARHRAFMTSQDRWLGKARQAPASQQAIWARGDRAARLNAASALDLDDTLIQRGQSIAEVNACLSDDVAARALIDNSNADRTEFGVPGTPSFALDGALLEGVHSWEALYPVLSARFKPDNSAGNAGD